MTRIETIQLAAHTPQTSSPLQAHTTMCTAVKVSNRARRRQTFNRIWLVIGQLGERLSVKLRKWEARRNDRDIARRLLELDDAMLEDMALTRGDVHHVLASPSHLLSTERLRLIGVERRAIQRADFTRRAKYLNCLLPDIEASGRADRSREKLGG